MSSILTLSDGSQILTSYPNSHYITLNQCTEVYDGVVGDIASLHDNESWGVVAVKFLPFKYPSHTVYKHPSIVYNSFYSLIKFGNDGQCVESRTESMAILPRIKMPDGRKLVLTRSNGIYAVVVNKKLGFIMMFGDFEYKLLDAKSSQNAFINVADAKYDGTWSNIIKMDLDGYVDTGFTSPSLDGYVYCVARYDRVNQYFEANDTIGAMLIGGSFTNKIKRIDANGQEFNNSDGSAFNPAALSLNNDVYAIEIDGTSVSGATSSNHKNKDVKIYIGGDFTSPRTRFMRIKNTGATDSTWTGHVVAPNDRVYVIRSLQYHTSGSDNIILIGGKFTTVDSYNTHKLCKVTRTSGDVMTVVEQFAPFKENNDTAYVKDILEYASASYDYILVGGNFTNVNYGFATVHNFVRLSISDGSISTGFDMGNFNSFVGAQLGVGFDGEVSKILMFEYSDRPSRNSNRIFVFGSFTRYSSNVGKYYVIRLLNDPEYYTYTHSY